MIETNKTDPDIMKLQTMIAELQSRFGSQEITNEKKTEETPEYAGDENVSTISQAALRRIKLD